MKFTMNNSGSRFMKTISYGLILATSMLLVACGGSSSGSFQSGGTPSLSITAGNTQVQARNTTQINVHFRGADGKSIADGTEVVLRSDNELRGLVSAHLEDDGEGGGSIGEASVSASASTVGGRASFTFIAGDQTGPVQLTASGTSPSGVSVSAHLNMTVIAAATPLLEISGASTMPANKEGVGIFYGSPFINELTIRYRNPDGSAGEVEDGKIAVAIAPVFLAAYSTLDDPETEDINEFFVLMGSGPVNMNAGVATIFVHSDDSPGIVTVSVTAQDASSGEFFSEDFQIEIVDGAANFLPSNVSYLDSGDPVYVTGSGGSTSKGLTVYVTDAGGNSVADPQGYDNVKLSLDAPAGSNARLTGTGANGSVSGQEISVHTVNGLANFALVAGSVMGPHRITATVDRADNNVSNDLMDPLSAETVIEIADGRLHRLTLVSPNFHSIRLNRVGSGISTDEELLLDPNTGLLLPPDPNGTYSMLVTAHGTDKAGNPVIAGGPLAFGKIDDPLTAPFDGQRFVFSGVEGDPQEGGRLFTILDNVDFLDDPLAVDDAVEPGDTLVTFGHLVPGNREHEAARFVEAVIDDRTVRVSRAFNANNPTGQIIDDGHVIPWVIGRSAIGTIEQTGVLDSDGMTSVWLTYPINAIGRPLVAWSQGTATNTSQELTVAAVESLVFPGVAPLQLTVTPNQIGGNQEVMVTICLADGLGAPVSNTFISAAVAGGSLGSVSLDGLPLGDGTSQTLNPTGANGCVDARLGSQGLVPDQDNLPVLFYVGGASDIVEIVPPGGGVLSVTPSRFIDRFQYAVDVKLTLRLTDQSSAPIEGVELFGECDAANGLHLAVGPGLTDADGITSATVRVNLFDCDDPIVGEFQCTFTTASGTPVGVFTAIGMHKDDLSSVSPACP